MCVLIFLTLNQTETVAKTIRRKFQKLTLLSLKKKFIFIKKKVEIKIPQK